MTHLADIPENTTHVVSYWHVDGICDPSIRYAFFTSEMDAMTFMRPIDWPPECPIMSTVEDFLEIRKKIAAADKDMAYHT